MQTVHRQGTCQGKVIFERCKIGGQHQFEIGRRCEPCIGCTKGIAFFRVEIQRQKRLIHLHPLRACLRQFFEQLAVDRQEIVQQIKRVEIVLQAFPKQQEGNRPEQYRAGEEPLRQGFLEVFQNFERGEPEVHAFPEFRHDVMVVRIEPLGHFHGRHIMTAVLQAARHRKIGGQIDRFP